MPELGRTGGVRVWRFRIFNLEIVHVNALFNAKLKQNHVLLILNFGPEHTEVQKTLRASVSRNVRQFMPAHE